MISKIKGSVIDKSLNYLIVENQGIGYKIFATNDLISKAILNNEIEVFTYLSVRETALELYGFLKKEELNFFEVLLTISGIGPKGAMGVLSQASPAQLKDSISTGDYSILTKVSGIGKKTAQRIVLELKSKLGSIEIGESLEGSKSASLDVESIEALEALGYSNQQAREALQNVNKKIKDVGQRVKEALKFLARGS
ncbi:MAG: Holliday junction branch migration protein RuvA [Candidatus Moranbacteria bacterium]|nr:Holliday junction branch migration protein RuvA [Candidatus Moranbacteria bacterium]